jgi:hypothetical protein
MDYIINTDETRDVRINASSVLSNYERIIVTTSNLVSIVVLAINKSTDNYVITIEKYVQRHEEKSETQVVKSVDGYINTNPISQFDVCVNGRKLRTDNGTIAIGSKAVQSCINDRVKIEDNKIIVPKDIQYIQCISDLITIVSMNYSNHIIRLNFLNDGDNEYIIDGKHSSSMLLSHVLRSCNKITIKLDSTTIGKFSICERDNMFELSIDKYSIYGHPHKIYFNSENITISDNDIFTGTNKANGTDERTTVVLMNNKIYVPEELQLLCYFVKKNDSNYEWAIDFVDY